MRIKIYFKNDIEDVLLLKHKSENIYSFVNLTKGYIDDEKFDSHEKALEYLETKKKNNIISAYNVIDNSTFLDDGIFIGNYFIPNKNPKKINCKKTDLIYENEKIVGIKNIKFTCDKCSSPMNIIYGPHGFFIGCINWKHSSECRKNTISLNILDE